MDFSEYNIDDFYDETFHSNNCVRDHYKYIFQRFKNLSKDDFNRRKKALNKGFRDKGITFTVYNNKEGIERIMPFDLFPRVIPANEWAFLEKGLTQRIQAINLFLYDIYNQQKILKDKIIPTSFIYSSSNFRREFMNFETPHSIYMHLCGVDLIRDHQGQFLVLEDNGRCPSGVSYMIENRLAMKQVLPQIFPRIGVRSIEHYTTDLLETLHYISPKEKENPTIVVLTPGCYNSAYFEHCYLARKMGVEIVEGRDLLVRDFKVYMRTTQGLKQVDVIYRRVDDDFLDPSVFREESTLGVVGLINAYRSGNVTLANSIGTGVADDKAIYPFIPDVIRYYLDQEPLLPQVKTYLPYLKEDLKYVLENLGNLVIKSVNEAGGYGMLIGPNSTKENLEKFRKKIIEKPRDFIAQPLISLSRHPAFCDQQFSGRHIDLRPYVLQGKTVKIVPSGLTRVAMVKNSLVVNSSQGGAVKDTWVLN